MESGGDIFPSAEDPVYKAHDPPPFDGVTFRPSNSGGDVGLLVRSTDWSTTSVGPRSDWPRSLHCAVQTVLDLPTPAIVFWGPDLTQIYNEGYAIIMGPRHPRYFGATFQECWPEAYSIIHPWMQRVLAGREVVEVERSLIPLTRNGFVEECYFSFTFSPLRDDEGQVAGVLQIVTELTARILYERRQKTLRDVAAAKIGLGAALEDLRRALSSNPLDVAGFSVHLWDSLAAHLEIAGQSVNAVPESISDTCLLHVLQSNTATVHESTDAVFESNPSSWPEPIRSACILPIRRTRNDPPLGVVVLGISPRLQFDGPYKEFFEGVAREIAMNVSAAQAEQLVQEIAARTREVEEAHQELDRKKSELHAIMTSLPEAAIFTDLSGRLLMVNPAFTRIYGYQPEDVIGETVGILYAEARDFETRWVAREREPSVAPSTDESLQRRRDGSVFWCETVAGVVRDGGGAPLGYLELRIDVTARKQRDERKALLAEATGALVSSLDCRATLDAVAHLLVPKVADRCSIELLSGSGLGELELVADTDPDRASTGERCFSWPDSDGGARATRPERRSLGPGDAVDSILRVPLEVRGRILGAVTLTSAGSNHVYTEDDLALAEDLATRMSFAIDNARLYDEAKRAVQLRDEFLSIASHELRTPLAALKLQLHSVVKLVQERGFAAYPPETLQRLFDRAINQVHRLARLVDDLLDVSRLTSGSFDLQLEEADLVTLVRETVVLVAGEARDKDCVIHLTAPPAACGRWAPHRIEQVVVNLLTNAIKFGSGKPIEVTLERQGNGFGLRVRDHGIGIPPDAQARIFQRFERAVSSTAYGGLGLGLYIAHQIVTWHGGRIELSSTPGQGATFTVWLPVVANGYR